MYALLAAIAIMFPAAEQKCVRCASKRQRLSCSADFLPSLHASLQGGQVQKLGGGVHRRQLQE